MDHAPAHYGHRRHHFRDHTARPRSAESRLGYTHYRHLHHGHDGTHYLNFHYHHHDPAGHSRRSIALGADWSVFLRRNHPEIGGRLRHGIGLCAEHGLPTNRLGL